MLKNKRGITLIALIITIIVLLILAGITITMVVGDNGVLSRAKESKEKTRAEQLQERIKLEIANNEIAKYSGEGAKTKAQVVEELKQEGLLTEEEATQLQENDTMIIDGTEIDFGAIEGTIEFNGEKFSAIYTETKEYKENGVVTAWIPKGFAVGKSKGINKVSDGLVITDGQGNQFVWIPVPEKNMKVATLSDAYVGATYYSEPKILSYDTQANLDKYYGTKEDGTTPYFTLGTDFASEDNYREMAESVNEYGGFYIGRYETTIDSNGKIGSKYNTPILTANTVIKEGQNSNDSNNPFYYRWWGLYYASRHANVAENGSSVQTNMIWGQQWDKMIIFFGNQENYKAIDLTNTYDNPQTGVVNSGIARYTPKEGVTNVEEMNDKIFNIYDLRMNARDVTAETHLTYIRAVRGGRYDDSISAHIRDGTYPDFSFSFECTRLTLYIK